MSPKTAALMATAVLSLGLGGTAGYIYVNQEVDEYAECRVTQIAGGGADIGGPFELISETGAPVTSAQVIDGPTLIYFGYTFCPDFCPLDLARNADAVAQLEERGIDAVEPVFITIDPERDTVEQVRDYTDFMHDRMLGLTGGQDAIDAAIRAYRVYARKVPSDDEYYLMDHSSFSYLMAPEGLLEVFPSSIPAETMANSLECFVQQL
jgi:protein SCO1/2